MLQPENWLELKLAGQNHPPLQWLVSTEFLTDEEAARRMPCFKRSLRKLSSASNFAYSLLYAAGAFRRWRCVEVVLEALRGRWPNDSEYYSSPDLVLCRAILDAVHGEPGCADGRIIRKLLRTGARSVGDFYVNEDVPRYSPFRAVGSTGSRFDSPLSSDNRTASIARPPLAWRCVMPFLTA